MTALLTMFLALSLPAGLTSKAKSAFADIQKAKSSLSAGKTKSSETWLTRAEALLESVLSEAPGGKLLGKLDQAQSSAKQGDSRQSGNALSQAESQAAKLDPSLASKLGVASQAAQQGDTGAAQGEAAEAKKDIAGKTGLGEIQDAYEKVKAAKALLGSGETSKAKGLLDQIPSLPQL